MNADKRRYVILVSVACSSLLPAGRVKAADAVDGRMFTAGVTGREAKPHGWVEEKVYVGALDAGVGAGVETRGDDRGRFRIESPLRLRGFPAGPYALFTLCYDAAPAFSFDAGLRLPEDDVLKDAKLETPAHYSAMFNAAHEEWDAKPWLWGADVYQTFIATSRHVTRIATKLAGKSGDHNFMTLNYAIYAVGDGPPSSWKRISPVRSRFLSGGTDPIIHIFWVPYQSKEVELEPGRTYAVRFWRDEGSECETFAMVVRPDKGDGYAGGHLYAGDAPRTDLDAYAYVSGGEPGTLVNHAPVGDTDLKELVGSSDRYGQTFRTTGVGLAGVDIIYATGDARPPALPITFQLYDKAGGKPIGPERSCYGLPRAFQGRAAAFWKRGEAPIEPGKPYYLEWTSPGCNTWRLNEDLPGEAYVNRKPRRDADLAMSIAEYASEGAPRNGS